MDAESKEVEILKEIRNSEKEAETIIEKAQIEKEKILRETAKNSSNLLAAKKEEIRKAQEKNLINFKDKTNSMKSQKLEEGKKTVKQIKAKAEKNISKAVDFIMKKFEAEVNTVSEPQNKN